MNVSTNHDRLQKIVCGYDFLALLPFALPFVTEIQLATLGEVNIFLGGGAWPKFDPMHLVLVQLLGIIATGWTIWRLKHRSIEIGRFEGCLRLCVALALLLVFTRTEQPLILIFGIIDAVFGGALIWGAGRANRQITASQGIKPKSAALI